MKTPHVSIILVNYNSEKETIDCIKSIQKNDYKNYTVYVIDNASKGVVLLQNFCHNTPKVVFYGLEDNCGFSAGNNVGIRAAMREGTDYILLLNNDTIVTNTFLEKLVELAESKNNVGIVSGKILYYSDPETVWFAGGSISLEKGVITHHLYNKPNELTKADTEKTMSFATGCLMLIPSGVVKHIGLLSEEYFLYGEDTDYCCRVVNLGFDIWYQPNCVIYHKVGTSSKGKSYIAQYYSIRNNYYLIEKYCPVEMQRRAKKKLFLKNIKELLKGIIGIRPFIKGTLDYHRKIIGKVDI